MSYEAWGEPDGRPFPPATTMRACMGGWCALRDHCAHYHSDWRGQPSERLCIPGQDGASDIADVQVSRQQRVVRIASQEIAL
jgi:hypothetical protein